MGDNRDHALATGALLDQLMVEVENQVRLAWEKKNMQWMTMRHKTQMIVMEEQQYERLERVKSEDEKKVKKQRQLAQWQKLME